MRALAYRATEAGIARIAAERRQAMLPAPTAPEQVEAPVAAPVVEAEPVGEPEKSNVIPFCPIELRKLRDRGMPDWAKAIVLQVASDHGVALDAVLGFARSQNVVAARNEAFYLLRTTPSPINGLQLSYPQIAGWFGREHTAPLYGASKHAFINGLPPISRMNVAKKMARALERTQAWKARQ